MSQRQAQEAATVLRDEKQKQRLIRTYKPEGGALWSWKSDLRSGRSSAGPGASGPWQESQVQTSEPGAPTNGAVIFVWHDEAGATSVEKLQTGTNASFRN